jgi:hypothetical protein
MNPQLYPSVYVRTRLLGKINDESGKMATAARRLQLLSLDHYFHLRGIVMSNMTKKMSTAADEGMPKVATPPKKGDRFHCDKCKMEVQITAECGCKDSSEVYFQCCGQPMRKV